MGNKRGRAGGRREDVRVEWGRRRRKTKRVTDRGVGSGKARPQEMTWKRRGMTAIKGFPKVDKPLRKGERTIKKELEKNTIVVMPDVRNPPRRGVEGDRGKEGG